MPEEKEKIKTRPKKEGDDAPIEDDAPVPSGDSGKIDDAQDKAKVAKSQAEKYRKRARERMARVTEEDTQIKHRDKQHPGE